MSLDVYLSEPPTEVSCVCETCELRHKRIESQEVYSANITHNLNNMAREAGIYSHLWRPEEVDITRAEQLILPLREGLMALKAEPERFKRFNPANGWGSYEGLVTFVENYLKACENWPEAEIRVSR